MSKIGEYLAAAVGYSHDGRPASTTQFAFGRTPFQVSENENLENVIEVTTVCHSDAIVSIDILDEIATVSFDFSNDEETLKEFVEELEDYKAQRTHVTKSLNDYMNTISLAKRNEDELLIEDTYRQLRMLTIPFMLPTIMPACFDGTVQIGFTDDPKFILYTSDCIDTIPSKITMIFDVHSIFCQDDVDIYAAANSDAEIAAQQEDLWYMQEIKKMEEENYQSQFGSSNRFDDDDEVKVDKRLKGARFK